MIINYSEIRGQLWSHYQHLLQRAEETSYPIKLVNTWGETIYQKIITPNGLKLELDYTQDEIKLWKHYQEQDKR